MYLLTVFMTSYSLTGFYTDIFVSIGLVLLSLRVVFRHELDNKIFHYGTKTIAVCFAIIVLGSTALHIINPFAWNVFDVKEFAEQSINGRKFRAYFKPVGAWGRGYGSFWITESSKYAPMFERTVYNDNSTDYNFKEDYFEETPVDKIVTAIIEEDIIGKER